jgi:hypothetical protein
VFNGMAKAKEARAMVMLSTLTARTIDAVRIVVVAVVVVECEMNCRR